jgi:hypothetical protein
VEIDEHLGVIVFHENRVDDGARDRARFIEMACFDVHNQNVMRRKLLGDGPPRPWMGIVP